MPRFRFLRAKRAAATKRMETFSNSSNGSSASQGVGLFIALDLQIGMTIVYAIVFLISLLGNTVMIYVIFKTRELRTTTNVLLANMAVADLLITFFTIPYCVIFLYLQNVWFPGIFGDITCKIVQYILALSIAASILTHVFIALERYFCIVWPFKRIDFVKNPKISYSFIWCSSFALMSPYLITYRSQQFPPDEQNYCVVELTHLKLLQIYFALVFIFLYVLPLAFIATLYILVCRRLWYHKAPGVRSRAAIQTRERRKRRTVKMLVILVITFAVCWLPAHVMHLLHYFCYDTVLPDLPIAVEMVSFWACHSHSAINPILVTLFNELYQDACRSILRRLSSKSGCKESVNVRLVPLQKQNDCEMPLERYTVTEQMELKP
ncbi:QRFP-like peptide receptor isoform X1 [Montipora foliosa]|uniref:QRFP-like peptide receptor isoform X1 n=1 Tax=Montipora foliosa TaxID=591990 RepID=UPI0035F180A9